MNKLLRLLALSLTFLFCININLNAQNDYNKTDKQGRRQGKWIDFHQNGKVRYEGEFKNNEPIGTFLYYSEDGKLIAKNQYVKNSKISEAELYSPNGNIIAKGKYLDKKKHEKWEYFSEESSVLILEENYDNGVVVGKTLAYSPVTQIVIEEIEYVDGIKNGVFNKYYDNGRPMVKAFYKNDELDGSYVSYYPNGVAKESGNFVLGRKVGEWTTYDMEENIISVDNFILE
ncbi:MAG: hypothetical protein IJZ87_06060 [Bacteroidales bacterium]|nr:hypothetical protein [Bacteroidales bacterium]